MTKSARRQSLVSLRCVSWKWRNCDIIKCKMRRARDKTTSAVAARSESRPSGRGKFILWNYIYCLFALWSRSLTTGINSIQIGKEWIGIKQCKCVCERRFGMHKRAKKLKMSWNNISYESFVVELNDSGAFGHEACCMLGSCWFTQYKVGHMFSYEISSLFLAILWFSESAIALSNYAIA